MADLRVNCKGCKRQFRPRKGTKRIFCESCRPPRFAPSSDPSPIQLAADRPPGEVERVVRKQLEAAERAETVDGVLALNLARKLDDPSLPGAQASSLAKQVGQLVDKAMVGVRPEPDFVDDLAARRTAIQGA